MNTEIDKLLEEADTLTLYQLRAKVRQMRKIFCDKALCTMYRAELLENYKIFIEMKEKFDAAYAKGFTFAKPKPRKIPVADKEIGDTDKVELKIPDVPAPRGYMKSKE
jgi:hypothetical protein